MNIKTLPIDKQIKILLPDCTYIAEGKVRNVYKIKHNNNLYVIKEWKKLKNKNDRNNIKKEIEEDTRICQTFFRNYVRVVKEQFVNNDQWRELNNSSTGYIRTLQKLIIPIKKENYDIDKLEALINHIWSLMIKVSNSKEILFPDLNIENFIITNEEINYIDSSSYLVSIKNTIKEYRVEDLLHKYLILRMKWLKEDLEYILSTKEILEFKNFLIENRGFKYCEELFSGVYDGHLRYWSNR